MYRKENVISDPVTLESRSRGYTYTIPTDISPWYIIIPSFIKFRQIFLELSHGNESVEEEQEQEQEEEEMETKTICSPWVHRETNMSVQVVSDGILT